GRERLAERGEAEGTAAAHAAYYLALAEAGEAALKRHDQRAWLERLEREHDNPRAALGWARAGGAIEVGPGPASRPRRLCGRHGHRVEGVARLDELLAQAGDGAPAVRARALMAAGRLSSGSDPAGSVTRSTSALELGREIGDRDCIGHSLNNLGLVAQARADC